MQKTSFEVFCIALAEFTDIEPYLKAEHRSASDDPGSWIRRTSSSRRHCVLPMMSSHDDSRTLGWMRSGGSWAMLGKAAEISERVEVGVAVGLFLASE